MGVARGTAGTRVCALPFAGGEYGTGLVKLCIIFGFFEQRVCAACFSRCLLINFNALIPAEFVHASTQVSPTRAIERGLAPPVSQDPRGRERMPPGAELR